MFRTILGYGLIAGAIVGVPLFAMPVLGGDAITPAIGMTIGYLSMLIAFTTIFLAIKRQRDLIHGGVIRFWPALAIGLGITLVASLIYVLVWEAVLAATQMDFIGEYAAELTAQKRAAGASEAELARFAAEMDAYRLRYADPLHRLPMTFAEIFPVGVLVSVVCAGLLSNRRFLAMRRDPA